MQINGIKCVDSGLVLNVDELKPYSRNAKKHPQEQVEQIKASIQAFGFDDPIAVWGADNLIVEGHGRLLAAKELGMKQVPCIRLDHMTAQERKAYTLAHNKLTMNSGFDDEMLNLEIADITDFDMTDFGFDNVMTDGQQQDDKYTTKVNVPQYEPTGEETTLSMLYDKSKAEALMWQIENSDIPNDVKDFLNIAAGRHVVFNYRSIAEYYAQATAEVQRLMEKSALVIIDINDAIAQGYAKLKDDIQVLMQGDDDA